MTKSVRSKAQKRPQPIIAQPVVAPTPALPACLDTRITDQIVSAFLTSSSEHIDPGGGDDFREATRGEWFDAVRVWQEDIAVRLSLPGSYIMHAHAVGEAAEHLLALAVSHYPERHLRDPDQREEWATATGIIRIAHAMAEDLTNDGITRKRYASTASFFGWIEDVILHQAGPRWFAAMVARVMVDLGTLRAGLDGSEGTIGRKHIATLAEATAAGLGLLVLDVRENELQSIVRSA